MANQPLSYRETMDLGSKGSSEPMLSPGYAPYPEASAPPPQAFGQMYTPPSTVTSNVVVVAPQIGGCAVCRIGSMKRSFTCCGICWAICCFPIGIICCFCMRRPQCRNCGYMV